MDLLCDFSAVEHARWSFLSSKLFGNILETYHLVYRTLTSDL